MSGNAEDERDAMVGVLRAHVVDPVASRLTESLVPVLKRLEDLGRGTGDLRKDLQEKADPLHAANDKAANERRVLNAFLAERLGRDGGSIPALFEALSRTHAADHARTDELVREVGAGLVAAVRENAAAQERAVEGLRALAETCIQEARAGRQDLLAMRGLLEDWREADAMEAQRRAAQITAGHEEAMAAIRELQASTAARVAQQYFDQARAEDRQERESANGGISVRLKVLHGTGAELLRVAGELLQTSGRLETQVDRVRGTLGESADVPVAEATRRLLQSEHEVRREIDRVRSDTSGLLDRLPYRAPVVAFGLTTVLLSLASVVLAAAALILARG